MTLEQVRREFFDIMTTVAEGAERDRKLTELMTAMEIVFSIPALRSESFEQQKPEVMSLYREISENRNL